MPLPISDAKLVANRANSQRSTGPKTDAGLAASSQNRLRHGLTGKFELLKNECREDFDELRARLYAEHQPATETECILVDKIAQHHWLVDRAITEQTICLEIGTEPAEKSLALMLRYQTVHERAFHRTLEQLRKLQTERKNEQVGFVSQEAKVKTAVCKAEGEEIKLQLLQAKLEKLLKAPKLEISTSPEVTEAEKPASAAA